MPFKPGGGGRPAGVRNRFSHAFLTDFLADWGQHGAAAIKTVRVRDATRIRRYSREAVMNRQQVDLKGWDDVRRAPDFEHRCGLLCRSNGGRSIGDDNQGETLDFLWYARVSAYNYVCQQTV